jgi:hypothetical protein
MIASSHLCIFTDHIDVRRLHRLKRVYCTDKGLLDLMMTRLVGSDTVHKKCHIRRKNSNRARACERMLTLVKLGHEGHLVLLKFEIGRIAVRIDCMSV